MNCGKAFALVRYACMMAILQIACEIVSYSSQLMYHSICCSDFKTYYIMHTSKSCQVLKDVEYMINPKRILMQITDKLG